MCCALNKWLEISGQVLPYYLNCSINEHENGTAKVLMSIGNIPLTLGCLGFLTAFYMLNVLQFYCTEDPPSNIEVILSNTEDPEISSDHSSDSSFIDDITHQIHHSASRLRNKQHEARCMELLEMYPDAVNTPKAPLLYTPFLKACSFGNYEAVKYMIMKGADIRAQTKDGETPFFLALWKQLNTNGGWDPSCIEILYRAGCDVNAAKRHGYTPLHAAAKAGNVKAIKWLLEHGADPHCLTRCKLRPIDYAIEQGHSEAAALLKMYS